mmetsp:Transcript_4439/g.11656  ORF Transcript_4439/g.11656 Transcript_4439/m.11656 type:complete len:84 (+) Transcript_4439:418-669(+)
MLGVMEPSEECQPGVFRTHGGVKVQGADATMGQTFVLGRQTESNIEHSTAQHEAAALCDYSNARCEPIERLVVWIASNDGPKH